jgi:hypothetical protein
LARATARGRQLDHLLVAVGGRGPVPHRPDAAGELRDLDGGRGVDDLERSIGQALSDADLEIVRHGVEPQADAQAHRAGRAHADSRDESARRVLPLQAVLVDRAQRIHLRLA